MPWMPLAMLGRERVVQLLGLLPVADVGASSAPQYMCGLLVCDTVWERLLLCQTGQVADTLL